MSEMAISGFTDGSKYATISKDFYKEVITELQRIGTSLTVEDAKANANGLIQKLQGKYEPKYDVRAKLQASDAQKLQGSI